MSGVHKPELVEEASDMELLERNLRAFFLKKIKAIASLFQKAGDGFSLSKTIVQKKEALRNTGELEGAAPASNEIKCLQMPAQQAFAPQSGRFSKCTAF